MAADLLTGTIHWTFDTWGDTTTPVFGKACNYHEHVMFHTAIIIMPRDILSVAQQRKV